MAITPDNAAILAIATVASSATNAFTTSGTNRILFVGVTTTAGVEVITGVTYAGVSMVPVQKQVTGTGLNSDTYLYVLVNPASGPNNVVVSCSVPTAIFSIASSYNGAAQSGQPDASNANLATGTPTTYTTSLVTGSDNDWMVLLDQGYGGNNPPSAGTGATRRAYDTSYGTLGIFDSNALITPSGTNYSMTTTRPTAASNDVHLMASIKPFVSAYTVSGTILDGSSTPIAGVTVSCTGQTNTTTATDGTYSFSNVAAGTVTITPTKYAWTFAPTSVSPTISADTVENFTGTVSTTYSISGNSGITAATISYTGSKSGSVTAAGDGTYLITGLLPGSYTITPSKAPFVFSPTSANPTITSSNVTGVNFAPTLQGLGIWQKQGVVIPSAGFGGGSPAQPNVLYEANPQILSANADGGIFKMWFDADISGPGNGIMYAESADGLSWTAYSGNPLFTPTSTGTNNPTYSRMFKNAGTYYYYAGGLGGPVEVWTCTDGSGINFTQANASALTHDASGWDTHFCNLFNVAGQVGSVWYGYYFGSTSDIGPVYAGQAYSSDLIHWTKSAGNPAITYDKPANFFWKQINGKTYGWTIVQLPNTGSTDPQLPSDFMRFVSTSPAGPFTPQGFPSFYRTINAIEGVISQGGQVADPSMVVHNGNIYLYNTVGTVGNPGTIECSIAFSTTFNQLIQTYEGVLNIPIPQSIIQLQTSASDALTTFGANWTDVETLWGGTSWAVCQVVSGTIEGTTAGKNSGGFYTSLSALTDQWSQITVQACAASSYVGVFLRTTAAGGYALYWNGALGSPGAYGIKKVTAGSFGSDLVNTGGAADGNGPNTVNIGDTLMGCIIGSTISFYHNGNLVCTAADSTFASGSPGFFLTPITSIANAAVNGWSGGIYAHSIGGNCGVAGATISYTGGSVTSDSGGDFIIPTLADGSQTITPSKTGYTFSPVSSAQTVSGADITGVNFTANLAAVPNGLMMMGAGV